MKFMNEVKTVLWSFVGLGSHERAKLPKVNPLALIAIALAFVFLFVAVVALVAKRVAG